MDYKILSSNKRYLPGAGLERTVPLTVVLVEGDVGDYAAYAGLGNDEPYIAAFGDKISFEEARCHFLGLQREKYRD